MATNGYSLSPIVEIAQLREQEAAFLLADLISQKQQVEKQSKQLQAYLSEYENRHTEQYGEQGIAVARLNYERVFIQRLGDLIQKQHDKVQRLDQMINNALTDWQSTKMYNKTLQTLIEKYRYDEIQKQKRRDQKESDEHNNRKNYLM